MTSVYDPTLGALYLGVVVGGILYGVTCLQTWIYYTKYTDDHIMLKILVGSVWGLDSLHQALITYGVYRYVVTNYDNPDFLGVLQWAIMAEVIVAGFIALIVQLFFVYRIYRLSRYNMWISGAVALLVFGEFSTYAAFFAKGVHLTTFAGLVAELRPLSYSINATTAATDVAITIVMYYQLQTSRTGFRRTDSMINRLTMYCVNTGLLTSTDAICSLISYLASQHTFIYIFFFFILSRLYSNSLMATLNYRRTSASRTTTEDEPTTGINSIPLRAVERNMPGLVNMSTLSNKSRDVQFSERSIGRDLTVKIDTTHETMRDDDRGPSSLKDEKVSL